MAPIKVKDHEVEIQDDDDSSNWCCLPPGMLDQKKKIKKLKKNNDIHKAGADANVTQKKDTIEDNRLASP